MDCSSYSLCPWWEAGGSFCDTGALIRDEMLRCVCPQPGGESAYCYRKMSAASVTACSGTGWCDAGTWEHLVYALPSSSSEAALYSSSSSPEGSGFFADPGVELLAYVLIGCVLVLCFVGGFVSGSRA